MELKIKLKYLIAFICIVVGVFTALYLVMDSRYHSVQDTLSTQRYESDMIISSYKIRVDSLEEVVNETEVLYVSSQKALNEIEGERDRLKQEKIKDVRLIGELNAKIEVLSKQLEAVEPVVIMQDCDSVEGRYMKIPQNFTFNDQWSWAKVTIDENPVVSFGVNPVPIHMTIGVKRGHQEVSAVSTENPYVDIDKNNVIVVEDKKWWNNKFIYFTAGVLATSIFVIAIQ